MTKPRDRDRWTLYLDERLKLLGWTRVELARRCGVTGEAIGASCRQRAFSVKLARKAEEATSGLLRATILVGLEEPPDDPLRAAGGGGAAKRTGVA